MTFATSAAHAESRVRARIDWVGGCGEREALIHELSVRGVALDEPTATDAERAITLSVSVSGDSPIEALLAVSDSTGRVHDRHIEVNSCDELRAVVAWVLLVLAREGTIPTESRLADASAAFATESQEAPAQRSDARIQSRPPAQSSPRHESATKQRTPSLSPPSHSALKLGSSFVSGFGFLPSPALGPALYGEFEPRAQRNPVFRASVFYLSTQSYERDGATIGVTRLAAQLSVRMRTSWKPLWFAAALEGGRLTAAGTGTSSFRPERESALWLAAELGPYLRMPLFEDVLEAELGGALAFTPLVYSLKYRGGDALSQSENLELRAAVGLLAKLP